MIIQQPWQQPFIEALQQHLYTHEDILALVVFGPAALPEATIDLWSMVTQLPTFPESYSATAIFEVIAQTAVLFDDLAGQWSEGYEGRKRPLLAWIQSVSGDDC